MKYKLKEYQKEARDELFNVMGRQLRVPRPGVCVLKAPTGSGKTVIVAELLKKLVKEKV